MFRQITEDWQRQGRIRADIDAGLILAMFDSLFISELQCGEIGSDYFPALIETLIEFIITGLSVQAHSLRDSARTASSPKTKAPRKEHISDQHS